MRWTTFRVGLCRVECDGVGVYNASRVDGVDASRLDDGALAARPRHDLRLGPNGLKIKRETTHDLVS